MTTATRSQKSYDHRLKELVHESGDIELAIQHGVPRSTARGWVRSARDDVVTRAENPCQLDGRTDCPRSAPHQLTSEEVATIRDMVTAPENRHIPTGTLALLAQRLGKVFASAST